MRFIGKAYFTDVFKTAESDDNENGSSKSSEDSQSESSDKEESNVEQMPAQSVEIEHNLELDDLAKDDFFNGSTKLEDLDVTPLSNPTTPVELDIPINIDLVASTLMDLDNMIKQEFLDDFTPKDVSNKDDIPSTTAFTSLISEMTDNADTQSSISSQPQTDIQNTDFSKIEDEINEINTLHIPESPPQSPVTLEAKDEVAPSDCEEVSHEEVIKVTQPMNMTIDHSKEPSMIYETPDMSSSMSPNSIETNSGLPTNENNECSTSGPPPHTPANELFQRYGGYSKAFRDKLHSQLYKRFRRDKRLSLKRDNHEKDSISNAKKKMRMKSAANSKLQQMKETVGAPKAELQQKPHTAVAFHSTYGNKHVCRICKKSFTRKDNLKKHTLIHTRETPHACHICNARFRRRDSLKSHIMRHTGAKSFQCHICKKEFTRNAALKHHQQEHDAQPLFQCKECNETFVHHTELITHEFSHEHDDDHDNHFESTKS